MTKIRVFEAFAGYGSQAMACKRLQQDFPNDLSFDFVGIAEIEPSAIKAYSAIHGDTVNYGDISRIDWTQVPDFDLFTYSFPCQSVSAAGKQEGLTKGSGTTSSLLWECERAVQSKLPKYLLMENVKALTQKKFLGQFEEWQRLLSQYGYVSYWKVLNARDFGVPQNRERVFMISILKDSEETPSYEFPEPFPLTKTVEEYMLPANDVDESYFIAQDKLTHKVLSDILEQPNVVAEFMKLYHQEEAYRRLYGRDPKDGEIESHLSEVTGMLAQMRDETDTVESFG